MFSFITGTLILSGNNNKYLKKNKHEEMERLGVSFVLSGIILLIGIGLKSLEVINLAFNLVGYILIFLGTFFLSTLIAALFLEFGKKIID